jgi:surface polysaccharide O-acyltransferase-like enzyme
MIEQEAQAIESRFAAVDLAKLAAAAAVVWIHVTNCDESREFLPLCRFAVPFFTCAAVYFVLHKVASNRAPVRSYSLQRARRLYVPFLVWSGVYLAARLVKHAVLGFGSPVTLSPAILLNGTAHHLWFLPFICLVSIITFGLAKVFSSPMDKGARSRALVFFVMGAALALVPCPVEIRPTEFPLSYFIDHAWDAMPAAFFGAGLFWLLRTMTAHAKWRCAALLLALTASAWEFVNGGHPIAPHLAGASLLFVTTTQANQKWMHWLWPWAELAFVIYLVHVLFVEALQSVVVRFGGVPSLAADLSVWALSLVLSALAARAALRSRALAWGVAR